MQEGLMPTGEDLPREGSLWQKLSESAGSPSEQLGNMPAVTYLTRKFDLNHLE